MSFSAARLSQLSAVTDFRPETLEKVLRLEKLLGDIAQHPLLSDALVLKGGTALNLFSGLAPTRRSTGAPWSAPWWRWAATSSATRPARSAR